MLSGCTVYHATPVRYAPASPSAFERSCNAALGVFEDQGIAIVNANRFVGMIQGRQGNIDITANLLTQPDRSVRVQFDAAGATQRNPS